jgi:fumarylpyruvate hydrolase
MGGDGREQPFFFIKSAHALIPLGGDVHYPPKTSNLHYETEMVVAISRQGRRIAAKDATGYVFGYAVGLDMTRRDLQGEAKKLGRPWEVGKAFESSAPCGEIVPATEIGHPDTGAIWLKVNGETRQTGDLNQMIWKVPEAISYLSGLFRLAPGDLIMTGTPAGVGAVKRGDTLQGHVDRVGEITVKVV